MRNMMRRWKVDFERATITKDGGGHEVEGPWTLIASEFVTVKHGMGSERRQAAADLATQSATFIALRSSRTEDVTERDRILFQGRAWDIHSIVPDGSNRFLEFTATVMKG